MSSKVRISRLNLDYKLKMGGICGKKKIKSSDISLVIYHKGTPAQRIINDNLKVSELKKKLAYEYIADNCELVYVLPNDKTF